MTAAAPASEDQAAGSPAGAVIDAAPGGGKRAPASAATERAPASAPDGPEPTGGMVAISAAEYAALLEDRRQLHASRDAADPRQIALAMVRAVEQQRFLRPLRSPIEADREVALFLAERFGIATLEDILAECRDRFGAERTPSRSSAHRFWGRLRKAITARTA